MKTNLNATLNNILLITAIGAGGYGAYWIYKKTAGAGKAVEKVVSNLAKIPGAAYDQSIDYAAQGWQNVAQSHTPPGLTQNEAKEYQATFLNSLCDNVLTYEGITTGLTESAGYAYDLVGDAVGTVGGLMPWNW